MFPLVATGVFLIIAPYFVKLLGLTVDGDATNPDLKADTKEHRAPAVQHVLSAHSRALHALI